MGLVTLSELCNTYHPNCVIIAANDMPYSETCTQMQFANSCEIPSCPVKFRHVCPDKNANATAMSEIPVNTSQKKYEITNFFACPWNELS